MSILEEFTDYVCLSYHEARNVRHLIKAGHVEAGPYELVRGLPTGRDEAWRSMTSIRVMARLADSAEDVVRIFRERFGLSLPELVDLYENPNWRSSDCGGNAWSRITARIEDLRTALVEGHELRAGELARTILEMNHNTGNVGEKLRRLGATDVDRDQFTRPDT